MSLAEGKFHNVPFPPHPTPLSQGEGVFSALLVGEGPGMRSKQELISYAFFRNDEEFSVTDEWTVQTLSIEVIFDLQDICVAVREL